MNTSICEKDLCVGCGVCVNVCPVQCIEMREEKGGFLYPLVDRSKCVDCGACIRTCPANVEPPKGQADFYMGWNRDQKVLEESSSGGIFSALADLILSMGGAAAGVYMDCSTRELCHILVEDRDDLYKLRKSKYYQSDTKDIYRAVRKLLREGRPVLFSGTACQCAALNNYLGAEKESPDLLTVDVLCHGVTSRRIVESYLNCREKQYRKRIRSYSFRVKGREVEWQGGGGTQVRLEFTDGTSVIENRLKDTFFTGFNHNLILRDSCYQCRYTGRGRVSDITLADYWGVTAEEAGQEQLKRGVSAFTVNSDKGRRALDAVRGAIICQKADADKVTAGNLAFQRPQKRPPERTNILDALDREEYDTVIRRLRKKYFLKIRMQEMLEKVIGTKRYESIKEWYHKRS